MCELDMKMWILLISNQNVIKWVKQAFLSASPILAWIFIDVILHIECCSFDSKISFFNEKTKI